MNDHVSEINLLDYLTKFSGLRTPLSDFYVKTKNCRIIGLFDQGKTGIGFLLAERGEVTELLFLNVENDDSSLKKELLDYLSGHSPSGSAIRWRIVDNPDNERLAYRYGFRLDSTLNIFHSVKSGDEGAEKLIREYGRLYAFRERHGYRTVSFSELTDAEIIQIRDNPDGEFDASLRPENLMADTLGGFSPQLSSASLKGGKVTAYTIVRTPGGKSCIFEIICVAESERKNGTFVLPFIRSLREIIASGIEYALFAVYETNTEMLKLVKKHFTPLIASCSIQHNMMLYVP